MKIPSAQELISFYRLTPMPVEGGLFHRGYLAAEMLPQTALPDDLKGVPHYYGSAIYALMTDDENCFSAMHTLPTDEIYHFYLGDALEILLLYPDGHSEVIYLGSDVWAGQHVQFVVPAGVWQGFHLKPGGKYGLIGTTMAPAFDVKDYLGGERAELLRRYPQRETLINRLTRPGEPLYRTH